MNILRSFIIFTVVSCCIIFSASAREIKDMPNDLCVPQIAICPSDNYSVFTSVLGFTPEQVRSILFEENRKTISESEFSIEVFSGRGEKTLNSKGFYFFKENKSYGHLFIHRKSLSHDLSYLEDHLSPGDFREYKSGISETLDYVRSLQSKEYLIESLGKKLTLYFFKKGKRIQLIGLIETDKAVYVVLEAYLPENLQHKYLKKGINQIENFVKKGSWSFP